MKTLIAIQTTPCMIAGIFLGMMFLMAVVMATVFAFRDKVESFLDSFVELISKIKIIPEFRMQWYIPVRGFAITCILAFIVFTFMADVKPCPNKPALKSFVEKLGSNLTACNCGTIK